MNKNEHYFFNDYVSLYNLCIKKSPNVFLYNSYFTPQTSNTNKLDTVI